MRLSDLPAVLFVVVFACVAVARVGVRYALAHHQTVSAFDRDVIILRELKQAGITRHNQFKWPPRPRDWPSERKPAAVKEPESCELFELCP
jgi:hypothetical protein